MKDTTSWGSVADWYHGHLEGENTYHSTVILPNLLRLLSIKKGESILDLACGQGFFARAFEKAGATVVASDISSELITIAKDLAAKESSKITYHVSPAHKLSFVKDSSLDAVSIVLAIQNIAEVKETFAEVKRALKPDGRFVIVMNHPAFRIPKATSWEFDPAGKMFRRIDQYLSEKKEKILMHPGKGNEETISFHRSLQYYSKLLANAGFAIAKLEEWISDKESQPGPRAKEENRMRKEIPLFLCFVALPLSKGE